MALPVLSFGTVSPTKAMVSAIMTAAPSALHRPRGDQQPERRRQAAQQPTPP